MDSESDDLGDGLQNRIKWFNSITILKPQLIWSYICIDFRTSLQQETE